MKNIVDFVNLNPKQTKRLNEIAQEVKRDYTNLVNQLSSLHADEKMWWSTPFSSRNTFTDSCFYDICLQILAIEEIERNHPESIIVPKMSIQRSIKRNGRYAGTNIILSERKREKLKRKFQWIYIKRCVLLMKRRISCIKNKQDKKDIRVKSSSDGVYLLCTYFIPSQFNQGTYKDRYFTGISDFSKENFIYFAQHEFNNIKEGEILSYNTNQLKNVFAFESFVHPGDFRAINEYVHYCKNLKIEQCEISGIDVTELVKDSIARGASNINAMYGILKGRALLRFLKKSNQKIKGIIDWYEGQPSSNIAIRELRNSYDEIPTFAYVISPCPENNLALYPSKVQLREKCVPKYFAIQGSDWKKSISQFVDDVDCVKAPSFRYQSIFNITFQQKINQNEIALVLPYTLESARQMLIACFDAIMGMDNLKISLKNHPSNANYKLRDYSITEVKYAKYDKSFVFGNMEETIKNKSIVILSETTAALEVLLSGIFTVIYIPPGRLDFSCLPEGYEFVKNIAYDKDDIRRYIMKRNELKRMTASQLAELREKTFTKTNKETMLDFLNKEQV